jgi:hypothetical protein
VRLDVAFRVLRERSIAGATVVSPRLVWSGEVYFFRFKSNPASAVSTLTSDPSVRRVV